VVAVGGGHCPPAQNLRGAWEGHRCPFEKLFATPPPVALNCPEHMAL